LVFNHQPAGRAVVDPGVTAIFDGGSRAAGRTRRPIDSTEIVARATAAMAAEGRAILAEGIALRASDIDLVLINGYGYPAWRGGPMFEAGIV
jgi:3-hydroxyacyl-CoA dehydrogenase